MPKNTIECPPIGRSGLHSIPQLYTCPLIPGWLLWHQHHRMLFDFSLLSSVQEKCRFMDYFLEITPSPHPRFLATMYPNSITNFHVSLV